MFRTRNNIDSLFGMDKDYDDDYEESSLFGMDKDYDDDYEESSLFGMDKDDDDYDDDMEESFNLFGMKGGSKDDDDYDEDMEKSLTEEISLFEQSVYSIDSSLNSALFEHYERQNRILRETGSRMINARSMSVRLENEEEGKEKSEENKQGMLKRVYEFIKRILSNVLNFFKRILSKIRNLFRNYDKTYAQYKDTDFSSVDFKMTITEYPKGKGTGKNISDIISKLASGVDDATDVDSAINEATNGAYESFEKVKEAYVGESKEIGIRSGYVNEALGMLKDSRSVLASLTAIQKQSTQSLKKLMGEAKSDKNKNRVQALKAAASAVSKLSSFGVRVVKDQTALANSIVLKAAANRNNKDK